MDRIAITGLGLVTPLGHDVATGWSAMVAGQSGIRLLDDGDATEGLQVRIAGRVDGLEIRDYVADRKVTRSLSRNAQFAVVAALEAARDARLVSADGRIDPRTVDPDRVGVAIGSCEGGNDERLAAVRAIDGGRPQSIRPLSAVMFMVTNASSSVSRVLGATGPSLAVATACATGSDSILTGVRLLRLGEADVVIAGGTEGSSSPTTFPLMSGLFDAMRVLSRRNDAPAQASRPFDLNRDGFVISEGAAIVVLERLEHARARDAHVYAELAGYGSTCDAAHEAEPNGVGVAKAMRQALAMAEMRGEDVDLFAAHGAATALGDAKETEAVKEVLGDHARSVAVTATKSMLGHLLGGAGALSTVAATLAIAHGVIPPTINYETPDPLCDLDYVPNVARRRRVRAALVNAFGLGGQNCVLALREPRL